LKREPALDLLASYGLKPIDLQVYLFLSKKGLCKGIDICRELKIAKQKIYPSLKRLREKGIVDASYQRPTYFSALPFEKVVENLIRSKKDEAKDAKLQKQELLSAWRSLVLG
jgi:sugar-specific transcriptional regulator TrmB